MNNEQQRSIESQKNIEQYVLDPKDSGAAMERENIAEYQETLKTMYKWTPNDQEKAEMQDFNAEPLSEEEIGFHLSIIEARMRKTAATEDVIKDQLAHLEDVAKRAREAALAKNEKKPSGQKLNARALELAALYHDCSKHTENKRDAQSGKELNQSNDDLLGHSFHSAIDVGKTLRKIGNVPEGVIKHIEQMILTHSSEEFPEMLAKKLGKAKELGQGQIPDDFYLMQPKDESAELLRSADLSNNANIASYKKYFPAHFTNPNLFKGNCARAAETGEKFFDIMFASFLTSTKDNLASMKDEAVRNTSGTKEADKAKFLAEDFFNRPKIQSRVDALRGRIEKITTSNNERVTPNATQLQAVKQEFDVLIDAAIKAY